MSMFTRGDTSIHYDVEGEGPPVLTLAPGGMRSAHDLWANMPWNPREALTDRFQVIGMDQRNAGRSTAPVSASDGWHSYRDDQLALLDHLDLDSCHLVGMCIGGPFIAALLAAAPERFHSAVMLQPVGIDGNRDAFISLFDDWADGLAADHPEASESDWSSFRSNMWGGDFVLTASTEDIAAIPTPLLVLMGNDLYHPESTSREVTGSAQDATLVESWKDPEHLEQTDRTIRSFLIDHTPD